MNGRRSGRGLELIQPPALYLLGGVALVLAAPLESRLGDELARLLACVAFNAFLYAVWRTVLPAKLNPPALFVGVGLGVTVAFPSVVGGVLVFPTALAAVLIVVDAAWEDLLFRGLAFDFAARRYGYWGAVALSSVCFASAHLLDAGAADPLAFTYLVLAGVVLGTIRVLTASLWPVIALHAAHNLTLACSTVEEVHWGSVAVAAVIAVALLARMRGAARAVDTGPISPPSSATTSRGARLS